MDFNFVTFYNINCNSFISFYYFHFFKNTIKMSSDFRFRKARFQHDLFIGYWVTLYFIYDGYRTYTFYNESDWIDNSFLMKESGTNVHMFSHDVLCTPINLPDLYQKISSLCV